MPVKPIDLRLLETRASNVYEAIIVASKRARTINNDRKKEFDDAVMTLPPLASEEDGEDLNNPQQAELSRGFENRPKPHIAALEELLEGSIDFEYRKR